MMKIAEVHCMQVSLLAKVTDPLFFFLPVSGGRMGEHHTSAAYSIFVSSTLLWSWRAKRGGTPLCFWASLCICMAYFSPFPSLHVL